MRPMYTIDIWIYIIIMILTGAWTGYITNDVAIKMLFKEYGIGNFKLGGVIVKTRKDLEKNLSKLVEKEIINHNTLKSQFHKPELKEAVSKTVVSFFNDAIFENTQNTKISELPGFETTIENTLEFLNGYLENHLTDIFIQTSKEIELSDVISSDQAYNLSEAITKEILKLIKEERILVDVIHDLYNNYQEVSIDEVVGDQIIDVIIHNLNDMLNNIFDEMRYKHDKEIGLLITKLYRDLDLETFVETLETYIGEKKISYFINEETLSKLYKLFNNYLKDPNSKESIEVFCEGLIIALKKIDKPVIELFSGDLRNEVEKFLETQLPGIIEQLIEIVQRNSHEIEELIESSIDQTIYDQQTVKRIILSAIRMFLIENFTQKYDIINKIVELLKGIDIDDLSKTISVQVVDILHQKSIASIIHELETNNILTAKLISSQVHRVLTFLLERYLSDDIEHEEFLNQTVNDLFKVNLKSFINNITVTVLTKQLIYNEGIFGFVKEKISQSLKSIAKLPVNNFITKDKMSDYSNKIQDDLSIALIRKQPDLTEFVYRNMNHYLEKNHVAHLINHDKFTIKNQVVIDIILKSIRNAVDDNQEVRIHDLFHKINSIDNLSENVVNAIMDFLDNGLSNVLEGNIAKVVEDNIKNLSNEEVLEMMQEFMGTKLKPLTIIGAFLGGFVGLILTFFNQPAVLNFQNLPLNMLTYAGLGVLTNVVAIFFIFRPYKPLFGIKGFQGIIPKQIPVLARAMGQVVSNNLLSDDSINNMIQNNEERLKREFKENVKKDNYKVLRAYLNENSENITTQTNKSTLKYLRDNNNMLATKFASDVMKLDLNKINMEVFINVISDLFVKRINDSNEQVSKYLMTKFKSSRTIQELSEELNINTIEHKIDQVILNEIDKIVHTFNDKTYLSQLMSQNRDKIDAVINKPLIEVLPEKTKNNIEDFLYNLVSLYLYSRDKQRSLSNYVINEITTILNNNDSLDELFGGKFIELINFNMSSILEKIEETVNKWLINYREEINESVTKRAYNELTVMQQVGYKAINGDKLIKETVYRIIEEKIPSFVSQKIETLNQEIGHFFDNLGKIRLKDARLELRKEELQDYLAYVFESKEIEIKTRRFINGVMDHFLAFETNKLFDLIDVYQTDDILHKFNDIFILINSGVHNNLLSNKEKIAKDVSLIINKFITKEILSNRVRNLTLGITKEEVDSFVENLIQALNKDSFLSNNSYNLVEIVFNHFKNVPVDVLLDERYLRQDLKKLISKLTINDDIKSMVYSSLVSLYDVTINQFDQIVDDELKDRLLSDIIHSAYDVLSENLIDILQAVDFKEVTEREINSMEAKQIKELFDSFGRKYFRKLELYGAFGGIFAVEVVSLAMFLTYVVQHIKMKSTDINK